jgi:hypothetical protein
MYAAMNYAAFINFIKNNYIWIIMLGCLSTVGVVMSDKVSLKNEYFNLTESLFYIQKISLISMALIFFRKLEESEKESSMLNYFAHYSFALYLIHKIIDNSYISYKYYDYLLVKFPNLFYSFVISLLYVTVIIAVSLLVCILFKKLLGKYSQYFFGA